MCIPILVLTPASDSNGPEPANANDDQGHPEGITTFDSAIAPFSGRAAPTMVVLSLGQVRLVALPAILLIDLALIEYTVLGPRR